MASNTENYSIIGTSIRLNRMGYGAMRLSGPGICVVNRQDDSFIDRLAQEGIANEVARQMSATVMQVAIAWILQRSRNILAIPGTSTVAHLRENIQAASLQLTTEALEKLDGLANA